MTHIFSSKSDSTIANVCLSVCHRNPSESSLSVITCICHLSSIMHFPYQPSYPSLSKSWISAIMPISLHANPSLWPNMCLSAIWSEFAAFKPFGLLDDIANPSMNWSVARIVCYFFCSLNLPIDSEANIHCKLSLSYLNIKCFQS